MHAKYWDAFENRLGQALCDSLLIFNLDRYKEYYRDLSNQSFTLEQIEREALTHWRDAASAATPNGTKESAILRWDKGGIEDSAILDFSDLNALTYRLANLALLLSHEDPDNQSKVDAVINEAVELITRLAAEAKAAWASQIPESNTGSYARRDRLVYAQEEMYRQEESQPLPPARKIPGKAKISETSQFTFPDPGNLDGAPAKLENRLIATKPWDGAWGDRHRTGKASRKNPQLLSEYGSVEKWAKEQIGWSEYLGPSAGEPADEGQPSGAVAETIEIVEAQPAAEASLPIKAVEESLPIEVAEESLPISTEILSAEDLLAIHEMNQKAVSELAPANGQDAAQEVGFSVYRDPGSGKLILVIDGCAENIDGIAGLSASHTGFLTTPLRGAQGLAMGLGRILSGQPLKGEIVVRCDDKAWNFMPALLKNVTAKPARRERSTGLQS
ncbi:hypothetical protein [Streptomyces sp. NPDC051014]|uniref:hypothetical protein n=1 Tax=Streptomyces sp. NPDC051014 TaxID=3155751 RepID=UPI00340C1244